MTSPVPNPKAELRREIRAVLKGILPATRSTASAQIRALLKRQEFWQKASSILFFASMPDEVDLWPLLDEALAGGKIAALPRYNSAINDYQACRVQNHAGDVGPGQFGIREPKLHCPEIPVERLGLILVPGLAFDHFGRRLGRGRGFYDRLLAGIPGTKCGVAFDEQIVETVPAVKSDVAMDYVLTPTRCVKCDT